MKNNIFWKLIATVFSILFLLIIFVFVWNFNEQNISKSINDWGAFGSFFGGVFSILISVCSIIVLGYISLQIGRNSVEENKKLYFQQKKIEAYDSLLAHYPELTISGNFLTKSLIQTKHNIELNEGNRAKQIEIIQTAQSTFNIEMRQMESFVQFLMNFEDRYSHLFNYNFKQEDFIRLKESANEMINYFNSIHMQLVRIQFSQKRTEVEEKLSKDIKFYAQLFTNSLKEELAY